MNYLIINGSPHKGNTWKLVRGIAKEIKKVAPESKFRELQMPELQLPLCTGCSNCFRLGHEYCPHKEKMQKVLNLINWCDGLILATTTFNMQPAALTKNLIDHLCYALHRPEWFYKKALVVTTTAFIGADQVTEYLAGTLRGLGFNNTYELALSSNSWNAYQTDAKTRRKCRETAHAFHKDVASGELHRPAYLTLIPYNLFRGMCPSYVPGTEYEYYDGIFWTDPKRVGKVYGDKIPLSIGQKIFGQSLYLAGKLMGKIITVTYKK